MALLPSLQKRAVDLLPQLINAVKTNSPTQDISQHPVSQLIRDSFSSHPDRMMGAILMAYLTPIIRGDRSMGDESAFLRNMETVVAGNIIVSCGKRREPKEEDRKYLSLPGSMYCMHRISEEVLAQQYGEETGKRLAASMAPLANDVLFPLSATTELPVRSDEVGAVLQNELELMEKEGINPFTGKTVREIGGNSKVEQMPQTRFFDYRNITVGGKYADQQASNYVSLQNQEHFFRNEKFDYVMSANVICPVVVKGTNSYTEAPFENGDLFCTCANITKPGGKIFHTNGYDHINSPPLFDRELHQFAGIKMAEPATDSNAASTNKFWAYTKETDGNVTRQAYQEWADDKDKRNQWETALREAVRSIPGAELTLFNH